MQLISYLTFGGNCGEAMKFYHKCLGGELKLQTIGKSPLSKKMPAKMKKAILQASLKNKNFFVMGSDLVGDAGLKKGNSVSLMLDVKTEKDMRILFQKLSAGGHVCHPVEKTFFGEFVCDFEDKFGINWIIHCNGKSKND
jgi:PhnB protein